MAEHRRNVTECWDGEMSCDRSKLSTTELSAVNVADHQRNYLACISGSVDCEPSRLTPAEAAAITTPASKRPRHERESISRNRKKDRQ